MQSSYRQSRLMCQRKQGFTAIELLVTLAIVAILAGLAAPSFVTTVAKYSVSTEHNNLVADLIFARSEAVRRGTTVTLCQSATWNTGAPACGATGWGSGRVVFVDTPVLGVFNAGDQLLKASPPISTQNTMIAGAGLTTNAITFSSDGTIATGVAVGSTITTCRSGYSGLNAVIQPIGRVSTASVTVCP